MGVRKRDHIHLATRNVSQDKSSFDKPCLEVPVGILINFSDLSIKPEKSKVPERVHPDLNGISFSAPLFTSEDKEDIKEKVVVKTITNLDVTNTSKVSQVAVESLSSNDT